MLSSSRTLETQVSDVDVRPDTAFERTEVVLQNQSQQIDRTLSSIEREVTGVKDNVDAIQATQIILASQLGGVGDVFEAALQRRLADHERCMKETLEEYLGCTTKTFEVSSVSYDPEWTS